MEVVFLDTVFFTSSDGYINKKLINYFLDKGYKVAALGCGDGITDPRCTFSNIDIVNSSDDVKSFIFKMKPTIFIHSAFTVDCDLSAEIPDNIVKDSAKVDSWLFPFLTVQDIKRVICLSTSFLYGIRGGMGPGMEHDIITSYNNYTAIKYNMEMAMHRAVKNSKRNEAFAALRVSPVYGKDYLNNLIPLVYDEKTEAYFKFGTVSYNFSLCHINNLLELTFNYATRESVDEFESMDMSIIPVNVCDASVVEVNEIITGLKKVFKEAPALLISPASTKLSAAKGLLNRKEKRINTNYIDAAVATSNHRCNTSIALLICTLRWSFKDILQ